MKKLSKFFWLLTLVCCAGMFAACDDKEDPVNTQPQEPPTITISEVAANMESISFKLTPANADAYEYGCMLRTDYESGTYDLTRVESGEPSETITVDGLTPSTEYAIVARAYYGDQRSGTVREYVKTLDVPAVAPVLTIADVTASATQVSFKLSHTGDATTYRYAVYAKGTEAPAEFSEVAVAEEGATTVTVDNLSDATTYTIEAYGVYGDLVGEHATSEFTTKALAVKVTVSEISDLDAKVTITMDKSMSAVYYAGVYEASNPTEAADIISAIQSGSETKRTDPIENKLSATDLLAGLVLAPDTEYVIWWVAQDADEENDTDELAALTTDDLMTTSFKTLPLDLTGSASVSMTVDALTVQSAKVTFTPNETAASYRYARFTQATVDSQYATDAKLAAAMLVSGIETNGTQTIEFTELSANTAYVFCTLAMDAEGHYGAPVKVSATTPDYELDSPVTIELTQLKTSYPEETAQFQITSDLTNVAEIRYINISKSDYRRDYMGKPENILSRMLSGYSPTAVTTPDQLTRQRLPQEADLSASTEYCYFVIMMDKDGKFTQLSTTEYKTSAYDLTGTANATWELGNYTIGQTSSGTLVSTFMDFNLNITPNSDCKEMWVYVVDAAIYNSSNASALILAAKKQENVATDWYKSGTSPWTTGEMRAFIGGATQYYVLLVCRSNDGRYNDVKKEAILLEAPAGSLPNPGEGEGEGGGDGTEGGVDPKE